MPAEHATPDIAVYLVDDDEDHLGYIRKALAAECDRFRFELYTSPTEALRAIRERPPDIVVSDYRFAAGEMNGIEFLGRAREEGMDVPFILLTGQGNENVAAEAFRLGAEDYYTKDIGFAHFVRIGQAVIRAALNYRHRRQADRIRQRYEEYCELFCEQLMSEANDFICLLDGEGRIRQMNRKGEEVSGYTLERVQGTVFSAYLAPADRDRVWGVFEELVRGGVPLRIQFGLMRPDGDCRTLDASASLVTTPGAAVRIIVIARDITAWKESERSLLGDRETLEEVLESMDEVIHVVDRDMRVLFCTRGMEVLSRGKVEGPSMVGKNLLDVFPFLKEKGVDAEYRQVFETGCTLITSETTEYEGKPGTTRTMKIPVKGSGGAVLRIVTILRDVSTVELLKEGLERKANELEGLNRQLSDFITMTSHEIRKPLANIEAFTQLVEEGVGSLSREKMRDFLGRIKGNTTMLQALINDLVLFARERKRVIEYAQVDIWRLLEEVRAHLNSEIERAGAEVRLDLDLWKVRADRQKLFLIIKNLIENAIIYGRQGVKPRIRVEAAPDGNGGAVIRVRDNGAGIPAAEYEKVFEIFGRGSSSRGKCGTGLGLAIVKENAEQMGGSIRLESVLGEGSTFTLTLPAP